MRLFVDPHDVNFDLDGKQDEGNVSVEIYCNGWLCFWTKFE